MSDTKWTPGPWSVSCHGFCIEIRGPNREWVASVQDFEGEGIANANKLAAAPSLYDDAYALAMLALQNKAYTLDDEFGQAVDNMLGTLAKARGE